MESRLRSSSSCGPEHLAYHLPAAATTPAQPKAHERSVNGSWKRRLMVTSTENNTRPSLCLQTEFRTLLRWEVRASISWRVQSHETLLFPPQVVIARSGQTEEGAAGTRRDSSPFSTARIRQSEPAELATFHVRSLVKYCVLSPPHKYILKTALKFGDYVKIVYVITSMWWRPTLVDKFRRINLSLSCGNS
jgi:hypothetical protein